MTAWRAATLSHGALAVLNMMKRVAKPSTVSILAPALSSVETASAETDSMTCVWPCWKEVIRAVASTRMS